MRRAFAPGRVNLIGDHTDHTGGYALPMAVQLGTTVSVAVGGPHVRLVSDAEDGDAVVPLGVTEPTSVAPPWARYVAGVVAEVRPGVGIDGTIATTLPVGAGLSSSASLQVAVALALGFEGSALDLSRVCQRAEQRASGVPCGLMDQLAATGGVDGHVLLVDCSTDSVTPIAVPEGLEVVAVHSGEMRTLVGSAYTERAEACERARAIVGPLRDASVAGLGDISDPVVRRRARHVITENERVLDVVDALRRDDGVTAGARMDESHVSLRDDFEVSTPALDALVTRLRRTPGVLGARLTGAGFGGCAVALCEHGALDEGWRLRPSDGARLLDG